jgi:pyruvate dehydrogenase E1 component alpha subunit/2-oxoisovalerate dehydrogenase E1 component alpha subunit
MMTNPGISDNPLGLYRLLDDEGRPEPDAELDFPDEFLLRTYAEMRRVRLVDQRLSTLYRQGRIGFYNNTTGQEAAPVAAALALQPSDWVFPALREGAVMLVRGFPLNRYVAQLFGTRLDILQGRQMPGHMSGRQVNQVSWSTSIGSQLPQAVGAAWAAKYRGDPVVALAFLGDGATSEPDFHAGMNFAAVLKTPTVFVCQNNQYALGTPAARQTASLTIAIKAKAYAMPGYRVDGNDVLATYRAIKSATERARAGLGPSFIETLTYRVGAHSTTDDPTRYRSEAEVEAWKLKDPVQRMSNYLVWRGLIEEQFERQLEERVGAEIAAAIRDAEAAGPPERSSLFRDVYQALPWHLEEQRRELVSTPPAPHR